MPKTGSLEVICGSMFSGKSEELMRRLRRAEYAQQNVLTIKHHIDNRKGIHVINSHDGKTRTAHPLKDSKESLYSLLELTDASIDVIGIDELHFFNPEFLEVIYQLVNHGKRVIVAGCDRNFRGEPFGITATLLALADTVTKLRAICVQCGSEATFTQRLVNGLPARYDDPIILVGAQEYYEARCRNCFVIDRPVQLQQSLKELSTLLNASHG